MPTLKQRLKLGPLFTPLNALYSWFVRLAWRLKGSPLPPPHEVKQRHLLTLRNKWPADTLIETGTYRGKMVFAMRPYFPQVYSIELAPELASKAQKVFEKVPTVHIVHGDSGTMLPRIVETLKGPAIFWLDGHYSGGETAQSSEHSPLRAELGCIFSSPVKGHVIAIDDAHLFNGKDGYPSHEELQHMVSDMAAEYDIEFRNNIVTLTPRAG